MMLRLLGAAVFTALWALQLGHAQTSCVSAADDEVLIEYFNQITFNDLIEIGVTPGSDSYAMRISCPTPESNQVPGPDFLVTLTTSNGLKTSCDANAQAILISTSDLAAGRIPVCEGSVCAFQVAATHRQTGVVFSTTELRINVTEQATIVPELSAATMPVCGKLLRACLVSSECLIGADGAQPITLCADPSSCNGAANKNYSYNESPYFEPLVGGTS